MAKSIKVVWVDSWRDIPCPTGDSTLEGYSQPKTGDIYLIRGVSSRATEEHEKYHVMKGHPDYPRDYRDYIQQELEATKYAYDQTKTPRSILMKLRGIFNDVVLRKGYNVSPKQAVGKIELSLNSIDAPKSWFSDFKRLKVEVRRAGGKL